MQILDSQPAASMIALPPKPPRSASAPEALKGSSYSMLSRILLIVFGVWACSTSVIFLKASTVHPILLAGYRCIVAATALAPFWVRDLRRHRGNYGLGHLRRTAMPAVFLAAHFSLWILGARMTAAAHATLVVNTVPIVMPFLLYFMVRETVTRGEIIGTCFALLGVGLLTGSDLGVSRQYVLGDCICFAGMLMLAGYMALGRKNRSFPTIWLYVVPLYAIAGMLCVMVGLVASLVTDIPLRLESGREILFILGLGIFPTVIGHSTINYSLKHFRGQTISIVALGEFIFAGIMAFVLLDEVPHWPFYVAAGLVVVGVVLAVRAAPESTIQAELTESPTDK